VALKQPDRAHAASQNERDANRSAGMRVTAEEKLRGEKHSGISCWIDWWT
jgi:hypothetical protein